MALTLKEKIERGLVTLEAINSDVHIIKKRFDSETGDEIQQQTEIMSRSEIEYFITMRTQQLEDLNELLKALPKEKA
jgi:hypothetical protein